MDTKERTATKPIVVVPRDKLIEKLDNQAVLRSPVFRFDLQHAAAPDAAMLSSTNPANANWMRGDLLLKDNGIAFLTFGHPDHPVAEAAAGMAEKVLHFAGHVVVLRLAGEFLSFAGSAAVAAIEDQAMRRRMLRELENPASLGIPATEIVNVYHGERDELIVIADDGTSLREYRFRAESIISTEIVWRMRLRFELWFYIWAITAMLFQQQGRDQKEMQYVADGWFAHPSDQRYLDQMDALFAGFDATWRDVVMEAYYHVQRFRKVPSLAQEGKIFWDAIDKGSGYQPICFACGKVTKVSKPQFCTFCGGALT